MDSGMLSISYKGYGRWFVSVWISKDVQIHTSCATEELWKIIRTFVDAETGKNS